MPGNTWHAGDAESRCKASTLQDVTCTQKAVRFWDPAQHDYRDLEYCFRHMPDDLIELAETVTGKKRCTAYSAKAGHHCGNTVPPEAIAAGELVCKEHINWDSARGWARTRLHDTSLDILEGTLADPHLEGVIVPRDVDETDELDPLDELLHVAGEVRAFKERIAKLVRDLQDDMLRYESDKGGEQLRAEVAVYERSLKQYGDLLVKIARLNIDERQMRITERQAAIVEGLVTGALADIGVPLELQDKARLAIANRAQQFTGRQGYAKARSASPRSA